MKEEEISVCYRVGGGGRADRLPRPMQAERARDFTNHAKVG